MVTFDPRLTDRPGLEGQRRAQLVEVMQAALMAVDPAEAVRRHMHRQGDQLIVNGRTYPLNQYRRIIVVGAGKADAAMTQAVEEILGDRLTEGAVNVKYAHSLPTRRVVLTEAAHPVPDAAGVQGSARIAQLLEGANESDLVICLISGGGSALMTLPAAGITLDDLQGLTSALLRAGANIVEINTIRKHLDRLKGGKLARLAAPATVISLILSDVVGNPLDAIASGPTVPDDSTFADAWRLLERYELVGHIPEAIERELRRGLDGETAENPAAGDPAFARVQNVIVASNDLAAAAAERHARSLGMHTLLLSTYVEGEAREVARVLAAIARQIAATDSPVQRPACVIVGGETTVTLRGEGRGGRNQEMALAAAIAIDGLADVTIACLATDGTDGPTDASGALAEGSTAARARALGMDPWDYIARNDAYRFFEPLGDLLMTGPTQTNVNDLAFVVVW
ncbi:MAG: glycerate kinase type-2 family protein [Anaerolineae bacterium]|jgi:glycerate 2-kinase|nr:glycerate kinase [Chloroflexota bacterium]